MQDKKIHLRIVKFGESGVLSYVAPNGTFDPYFVGTDPLVPDLLCGNCGLILATMIPSSQLREIVMQCPMCEQLNDTSGIELSKHLN